MSAPGPARPPVRQSAARRLYDPLDFAVLRAPALPVEFYRVTCGSVSPEHSLLETLENPRIRSAIAATSPSLARALASATKSRPERNAALRKLRRYLIRMCTRPTPFGAFAGVAIVPLSRHPTTLSIDETRATQFHYVDVPWLLAFVRRLESDPDILPYLKLRANPCALHRGGRIYIREMNPLCQIARTAEEVSLRATRQVLRALDLAQSPIAFRELASRLAETSTATIGQIHGFIAELWRQEFLLTDLRPPLTTGDPLPYVLRRLAQVPGTDAYRKQLEDASAPRGLEVPIGGSPRSGARFYAMADSMAPPVYRTETIFPLAGSLNVAVAEEAARAAELLLSFTSWPHGPPYLQAYRALFEDRYGSDREVPLLEMIDPEFGIGAPAAYDMQKTAPAAGQSAAWRERRDTLVEISRLANDTRQLEIELSADDIRRLRTSTPSAHSAPASLEINIFVSADSPAALDAGHFTVVVGPNVGAMEAGRGLGRFAQPLGPDGIAAYARAARAHQVALGGAQCAELSYLPRVPQLTNILVRPSTRQLEIDVGVQPGVPFDQVIPVSDLRVGVRGGRFYVRSLRFRGDLQVCSGHMANMEFAPTLCRLLADLMLDGVATLRDFDWGVAAIHHFLPRVRVGRAVLSVAKWRMTEAFVRHGFCFDSSADFRRSLERWRTEWKVPRYVHMTETDNRLVLDLHNDMDIADLRDELQQVSAPHIVTLEEVYPPLDEAWLPGAAGRFVGEYVISLALRSDRAADPTFPRLHVMGRSPPASAPSTADRVKTPGSDWLYLKLYAAPSLEDDLLTGPIRRLTSWAHESLAVSRWFFVRYADPRPHIRLRFQGDPTVLTGTLFPEALRWAQELVQSDRCLQFAVETYEREIDRYGGIHAIAAAEDLFLHDSEFALAALSFLGPKCPLRRHELAVLGLDALFRDLGWDFPRRAAFVKAMGVARQESGAAYRERKDILEALAGVRAELPIATQIRRIPRGRAAHPNALASIGRRLQMLEDEGSLSAPLPSIFRSLAHMHCNRLGLDQDRERLAYGLLARTYETELATTRARTAKPAPVAGMTHAQHGA